MLANLTEVCQELKNWFDREQRTGSFTIVGGVLTADFLLPGQYYRIIGSVFNDGVHQYGDMSDDLIDETFDGAVWALAIPPAVVNLADEIAEWRKKYESVDNSAMSPYMSESFGGYSYQKGSAFTSENRSGVTNWVSVYAVRLNRWRKL